MVNILLYFLNGNNYWIDRWESTNHDFLLLFFEIFSSLLIILFSLVFAYKINLEISHLYNSELKKYYTNLRNFFFVFAIIIFFVNIVCWFSNCYWIVILLSFYNSYQVSQLIFNQSKIEVINEYCQSLVPPNSLPEIKSAILNYKNTHANVKKELSSILQTINQK